MMKRFEQIDSIYAVLYDVFKRSIQKTFPNLTDIDHKLKITRSKIGDYQTTVALTIIQSSKTNENSSYEIAIKICSNLEDNELIERCDPTVFGFINIFISKLFVENKIKNAILNGIKYSVDSKKRAIVDYSSPNIAKQLHVGHLRSTIIGESISRLLEFVGYDILRLNHVGDWGTQFGMLIAHLKDKYSKYRKIPSSIAELQELYIESNKRFCEDSSFRKSVYECVVKLQRHDLNTLKIWKIICDISRLEFEYIYNQLEIRLIERGESYYQNLMDDVVKEFESKGLVVTENGCKLVFLPDQSTPLIIVKSDGSYTYDTSDLAAIKNRLITENGNLLLYVVDAGQSVHMKSIFSAAKQIGWFDGSKHRLEHIEFGVVLNDNHKRASTRRGHTVSLRDLLNESLSWSLAKLKEKGRDKVLTGQELIDSQRAIAYSCIKYAELSYNRKKDYLFSFNRMLNHKGNTAVYLLYTYARIRSILRLSRIDNQQLKYYVQTSRIIFDHKNEWKLAKCIIRFAEMIDKVLNDFLLHSICEYVYELATLFNKFYNNCYCIVKDKQTNEIASVNMNRLVLCAATESTLATCYGILGLKCVEKL